MRGFCYICEIFLELHRNAIKKGNIYIDMFAINSIVLGVKVHPRG